MPLYSQPPGQEEIRLNFMDLSFCDKDYVKQIKFSEVFPDWKTSENTFL